jgi:DNA modification methylase
MAEFARYGERKSGGRNGVYNGSGFIDSRPSQKGKPVKECRPDTGSAARFFYCAKASRSERTNGGKVENGHPTVKPLELCRYLARLTKTPAGGVVLDPFCGSGSIGIAALLEGRDFIGIEMNEGNYQTAVKRIEDWQERIQRHGEQVEMEP